MRRLAYPNLLQMRKQEKEIKKCPALSSAGQRPDSGDDALLHTEASGEIKYIYLLRKIILKLRKELIVTSVTRVF